MRQFILLFLFIAFVTAADDALIETEDGPKSSADLIKPSPASDVSAIDKIPLGAAVGTTVVKDDAKADAVASEVAKAEAAEDKSAAKSSESKESKEEAEGEKVEAVPKETVAVAHKKPGEKPEVVAATEVELKPVESESRAKREKEPESVLASGEILDVGAVGSKADVAASKAIADKAESSESAESKEAETPDAKKVTHEAVPTETVAVAHKKPGEEAEVATATKVDIKPVVPEAASESRAKREKEPESVLASGEILDVGAVGSKADVAASKAIADKSKSSESAESKEAEKEEPKDAEPEAVKVSKVPTEEVAVAHKKAGEDEVEIATATKSAIVAEKVEKSRARRFA